ncbi:DUF6255 family natural product biosynthesis protein [Streptomyces olivoreticuli]|uniref:DUF6255 family natural product biosynthesis protein n=1 Tax=Streptomyces olivoreticuli TaxID=68246 RepID=UPI0013C2F7C7|nr:DUF6255 family natural product biosynthesis protein [Streptomyces olivoreticuli]
MGGARVTMTWLGRLVRHCAHAAGWRSSGGVARCAAGCGTERFTGYEALLPAAGMAPEPPPPTDTWRGLGDTRDQRWTSPLYAARALE